MNIGNVELNEAEREQLTAMLSGGTMPRASSNVPTR